MISAIITQGRKLALVALGGLLLLTAVSCKKEQYPATTAQLTLQERIAQDTALSLFQLALHRTQLDTVLSKGGPNTIFAPVNSAFLALGLDANVISSYDLQRLTNIISYEIVPGRIGSSTVIGFSTDSVLSLNQYFQPIISLNYYGIFIDGIAMVEANIGVADGILHKTAQVALPPTGTLLQVLDSLPNTKMTAYIYHHSAALYAFATSPASLLTGSLGFVNANPAAGSGTLLVPMDAAFAAYGFNTTDDLAALDTLTRTNLVAHGMLNGAYFTSDFMGGRIVFNYPYGYSPDAGKPLIPVVTLTPVSAPPSYAGEALVNGLASYEFGNDGLTLYGNGILTPPMIIQGNIVANGGVVHIINQIFAPNGIYGPGHSHR
jgi:uncharacterized surface protein with fasciclin (FAS1) repeats